MTTPAPGLLGDTAGRDYSSKLAQCNAFAAPELQHAIQLFGLRAGMRVLDAGCGTGTAMQWLAEAVKPDGMVVGVDLAGAHVQVARRGHPEALLVQGDIRLTPLRPASFDAIWCVNTLHHLRDSSAGLRHLICLLRDQGRLGIVQSALLPEMVFAWDSRLERAVNDAVRSYYLQRYGVAERDLTGVRNLLGQLRASPLSRVRAQTLVIERAAPLSAADSEYLLEAIFRNTWGERLKPWLAPDDFEQLQRLCDPDDPEFALRRADFHYLQTLTLVSGQVA